MDLKKKLKMQKATILETEAIILQKNLTVQVRQLTEQRQQPDKPVMRNPQRSLERKPGDQERNKQIIPENELATGKVNL